MAVTYASGSRLYNRDGSILFGPDGEVSAVGAAGGVFIPADPEGGDQAPEIQAAIDAVEATFATTGEPTEVRLGPGLFHIGAPLRVTTGGLVLSGAGRELTKILPAAGFPAGAPDDPDNCLLLVAGELDLATMSTVLNLAAKAPNVEPWYGAGVRAFSVDDPGAIGPGDWIVVHGWETGIGMQPGGSNGSDLIIDELLQVESVAGNVIQLRFPTTQHHVTVNGPGAVGDQLLAVRAVVPAVLVEVRDIGFSADGQVIACGVTTRYSSRVSLYGTGFEGFTRFAVEYRQGARDFLLTDTLVASSNGGAAFISANNGMVSDFRTSPLGERFREIGVIRAGLYFYRISNGISVVGFDLRHMCQGIWLHAFRGVSIADGWIDDMLIQEKFLRDGLDGGVAIHMGTVSLFETIWNDALDLHDIRIRNCRFDPAFALAPDGNPRFFSIYYHDVYDIVASGIDINNDGVSPTTTVDGDSVYDMGGCGFQDCGGIFSDHIIKGVSYGLVWRSSQGATLMNWRITVGPGGGGPSPVIQMFLNSATNSTMTVNGMYLQGAVRFGTTFAIDPLQNRFDISKISFDGAEFDRVILARNTSGAPRFIGSVLSLDPAAATPEARLPVGNGDPSAVVVAMSFLDAPANGSPMFVSPSGSGRMGHVLVEGALPVAVGDLIETTAGQPYGRVNNAAAPYRALGQSIAARGVVPVSGPVGLESV